MENKEYVNAFREVHEKVKAAKRALDAKKTEDEIRRERVREEAAAREGFDRA